LVIEKDFYRGLAKKWTVKLAMVVLLLQKTCFELTRLDHEPQGVNRLKNTKARFNYPCLVVRKVIKTATLLTAIGLFRNVKGAQARLDRMFPREHANKSLFS